MKLGCHGCWVEGSICLVGGRLLQGRSASLRLRILPGWGLCFPHQTWTLEGRDVFFQFLPGPPTSLHLCLSHAKWLTPASPGIQTTVVFWPAKLQVSERVVMFRFEFWDCGESALKKFDHMLPVSRQVGLGGSPRGCLSQMGL